jgi:hypothetical protein
VLTIVVVCGIAITVIGLVVRGVQCLRDAAARATTQNQLRILGQAMRNYAGTYGRLPDPESNALWGGPKKRLSWRVAVVPFLDSSPLYSRFNSTEDWDGPTNIKLLYEMPIPFYTPYGPEKQSKTNYQVFTGPNTLFDGEPRNLAKITRGAPNTFLIVEATHPVEWTRPADLAFDGNTIPDLGAGPDGFTVCMADGNVFFIRHDQFLPVQLKSFIDPFNTAIPAGWPPP